MIDLENRPLLISCFEQCYTDTYTSVLKAYTLEEKFAITEALIRITETHLYPPPEAYYSRELRQASDTLYEKLKSKASAFDRAQFHHFYDPDIGLHQKGLITTEEFSQNQPKSSLTLAEYQQFLRTILNMLMLSKQFLYQEDEPSPKSQLAGIKGKKSPKIGLEFTTARQVLAMHYMFKALNASNKDTGKTKARFIHFLTGKNEHNIYKWVINPLRKAYPKDLQNDLEFIREYFQELGLTMIVDMIDREIKDNPTRHV